MPQLNPLQCKLSVKERVGQLSAFFHRAHLWRALRRPHGAVREFARSARHRDPHSLFTLTLVVFETIRSCRRGFIGLLKKEFCYSDRSKECRYLLSMMFRGS